MKAPDEGWKEQTYYKVKVSLYSTNFQHESIFYSGFLNGPGKTPGGYACFLNPTYGGNIPYKSGTTRLVSIEELFTKGGY